LFARLVQLVDERKPMQALAIATRAARLPELRIHADLVRRALRRVRRRPTVEIGEPLLSASWFDRGRGLAAPAFQFNARSLSASLEEAFCRTSLPGLLRYEDRSSMCFSIESRVPFLTPELAELAFGLPVTDMIDRRGQSKSILRRACRGLVPDAILDRKDKVGFGVPANDWLVERRDQVVQLLDDARDCGVADVVDVEWLRTEWRDARSGAPFDLRLWRGLNFALWWRDFEVAA
jgi:asparagine synthase (glutamine-hydrolysing)